MKAVLRDYLADESVSLSDLCDTIADLEKEQMVAISIERLTTGSPGSITEAKQNMLMIYQNSQNLSLQLWDPSCESVTPRPPARRQAQTFADWSTIEELEHEEKHFVTLVHRVQHQRQGMARYRLSFNTLKFARGVVLVKIWQLLNGVFSSLPLILAACYMILTSLLFSAFSIF